MKNPCTGELTPRVAKVIVETVFPGRQRIEMPGDNVYLVLNLAHEGAVNLVPQIGSDRAIDLPGLLGQTTATHANCLVTAWGLARQCWAARSDHQDGPVELAVIGLHRSLFRPCAPKARSFDLQRDGTITHEKGSIQNWVVNPAFLSERTSITLQRIEGSTPRHLHMQGAEVVIPLHCTGATLHSKPHGQEVIAGLDEAEFAAIPPNTPHQIHTSKPALILSIKLSIPKDDFHLC